MPPQIVIMFPDRDGLGFQGQFGQDLLQRFGKTAALVPIINGKTGVVLDKAEVGRQCGFTPVLVSYPLGLRDVLMRGYDFVSALYQDAIVVRLDTEDHPLDEIDYLIRGALETGMSVGCLTLSHLAATPGSIEDFVNADLFPSLFGQFTGNKLILTGASGFKVFAPGVCGRVFPGAKRVMYAAERVSEPIQLRYGFDFAMILSAFYQNIPIHVRWIPTNRPENKPRKRIIEQFNCALRVCRAAEKISWDLR